MPRARSPVLPVLPVLIGALAVVVRLPAFVAGRHLTFDDGVYGASAVAMRHGAAPFRDVFSSQGPLFLPLVRLADLLGVEARVAPRLLAVASGVVVTAAVFAIGTRLAGRRAGAFAALLVASSGSVLWVTGALASDGPTLAFGASGVAAALAFRDRPSAGRAVAVGALMGAAFSVKSLLAVPPGAAVAWVLLGERRWRDLALGAGTSAVVVLGTALPFGLSRVWDQAFVYHLEATGGRRPLTNLGKVFSTLWDRDPLVLVLFGVGAIGALAGARKRRSIEVRRVMPVLAWLVTTLVVLVAEHPMWRPHLAHLVAPMALTAVWWTRRHLAPFAALAAVVGVVHVASIWGIVVPAAYAPDDAAVVADLRRLPAGAFAISDEPGLVWAAGLRTPPDLVDTSILRVQSKRITAASIADVAADTRVCAVVVWSRRFGDFDLAPLIAPEGYRPARTFPGGRSLLVRTGDAVRSGCGPTDRTPAGAAPLR